MDIVYDLILPVAPLALLLLFSRKARATLIQTLKFSKATKGGEVPETYGREVTPH